MSHEVGELCDSTFYPPSSQVWSELQRSGQITNESVYSIFYLANLGNIQSCFDMTQSSILFFCQGPIIRNWHGGNIFLAVFVRLISKINFTLFHHWVYFNSLKEAERKHEARTRLCPSDSRSFVLFFLKNIFMSPVLMLKKQQQTACLAVTTPCMVTSLGCTWNPSWSTNPLNCSTAGKYDFWQVTHGVCNSTLFHFRYIKHIL